MKAIKLTLVIALFTGLAAIADTPGAEVKVNPGAIDAALDAMVTEGVAVGASALVYHDGNETYFGAFGMADREAGRPMARDTLVQIFSMTKPITGVALLQQLEQGKFELDDPVAKYLPAFADVKVYAGDDDNGEPILVAPERAPTIRDLTRHTAGLPNGWETGGYVGERYQAAAALALDNTLADAANALAGVPLAYEPGTRWLYSDAVDVQARLVEVWSGQAFADYIQANILDPLGMDDTGYYVPEAKRTRLAAVYGGGEEGGSSAEAPLSRVPGDMPLVTQRNTLTPGGWGLASTLDDYMRFARMLLNDGELDGVRVLGADSVKLMRTNQLPDSVTERSWLPGKGNVGFGIDVAVRVAPPANAEENRGAVGEYFWDGAASTLFWVDPANELAAVFFIQRVPFYGEAHTRIRRAVYGQ